MNSSSPPTPVRDRKRRPGSGLRIFRRSRVFRVKTGILILGTVLTAGALLSGRLPREAGAAGAPDSAGGALGPLAPRDFVRTLRVTGTTEATKSVLISIPRLAGETRGMLVITRIEPPGTKVKHGDVVVEFDRQEQENAAFDRRAEYRDLVEQIARTRAEQEAARVKDESEIEQAQNAVGHLELEVLKGEMQPRNLALENELKLEAARAKLRALRANFPLRRDAEAAALRILEIRRDRAQTAMEHAMRNAEAMVIRSPIEGLVVARMTWKGNGPGDVAEGDQLWPGAPVLDVVNAASMRVRARVNQADFRFVRIGQPVTVRLDAYDDLAMPGRVDQIAPLAAEGSFSERVRTFSVLVSVAGSHPRLMPDLTAAVDIELERVPSALIVPREAVRASGKTHYVMVREGTREVRRTVTLGPSSETEIVVTGGLQPGDVVLR